MFEHVEPGMVNEEEIYVLSEAEVVKVWNDSIQKYGGFPATIESERTQFDRHLYYSADVSTGSQADAKSEIPYVAATLRLSKAEQPNSNRLYVND